MTIIRLKGLKRYRDPKTGRWYSYHRPTGTRIMAEPGTAAFMDEWSKAEARRATPQEPKAGTLGLLMKAYQASHQFATLKPRTQADYRKVLNYLATIEDLRIADIDRGFIVRLRDKVFAARRRSFANYVLALMSILLGFALERGEIETNPARGVKKIRRRETGHRANRPWTAAERTTVFASAPIHLLGPLAVGRFTGMREGDVVRLPRSAYDGKTIRITTAKRGVLIATPAAKPLRDILARLPKHDAVTLLASSRGRPWTENGFRSSLFRFLRRLEAKGAIGKGLTFHGLRHTLATELAEFGFDRRTIADMLGQNDEDMAGHYSRGADLTRKLSGVVRVLNRAHKGRKSV